jgi:hypothetical protein
MDTINGKARLALAILTAAGVAACSTAGQIGEILGGVLGGGANMVSGAIRGVDTRNQQISLQQANGQSVALSYDNQTKVVYQDRLYSVTSLESGDQVNARVQQLQNGGYYADSVVVTQPVAGSTTGSTTGSTSNWQSLQGTVRQIDRTNAVFTIDAGNNVTLTVTMPYNASTTDASRYNNMRVGDYVRFYGVYVTNTRVDLKQFTQ